MVKREMWGPEEWGGHPTWTSLITSDESSPSIFVGFYYDELMMTLLRARSFFLPSTSISDDKSSLGKSIRRLIVNSMLRSILFGANRVFIKF